MKKLIIAIMVIFVLAAVFAGCADDRNQNNQAPGQPQVSPMVSPIMSPDVELSPVEITPLLPPADVSPAEPVSPMPQVSPS